MIQCLENAAKKQMRCGIFGEQIIMSLIAAAWAAVMKGVNCDERVFEEDA